MAKAMKMAAMKMGAMKMASMKTAMKSGMKRKGAMKASKVAKGKRAKLSVFRGSKEKTTGGLTKGQLKKNKAGKVVSVKASARAANSASGKKIARWGVALKKAYAKLGLKKFTPCKKGSVLYKTILTFLK